MKKLWIGIGVVVVVALAIVFFLTQTKREPEEIKIGVILPLTGELASHGEDAKRGGDLAIKLRNQRGGIQGRKIVAIYEDDGNNPTTALSAFNKLLTIDKVQVVLGGMTSTVALALSPIADKKKIVLFSPTASHPKLTKKGGYIFRNWPSDNYDAKVIAEFSYNVLRKRSFAILYLNNDNGRALSGLFARRIKALGGNILANQGYEPGTNDFRTVLSKIKNLSPDALYTPGYYEDVAKILVQAKEMGINTQFLASSAIENPKLIELAGNAAEGLIYSKTLINPEDENYKEFLQHFKNLYQTDPGIAASQCFDAVNIIIMAIERGGYKSSEIQKELYNIQNYPGVTGKTSFDESGNVIKEFSIFTVKNGKFTSYE
jgi:branched-chain amino acid transport system substrate-binding protein